MARYYDEEGYETPAPARPRRSYGNLIVNTIVLVWIAVMAFLVWPMLQHEIGARLGLQVGAPPAPTAPAGNVGGQAPPSVRGTNADPAPRPADVAAPVARPIPGIAQSQAEADTLYADAVNAANARAVPTPAALPLNSAGDPVIDTTQQQQMEQSLQLAEQEANAAADQQLADQRATADAAALSRAPDLSYQEAVELLHRDPCHVPRANPATCAQGLFKPTPIGAP